MTIYVLKIDHRHGYNLSACATPELAQRELEDYVRDNWQWEMGTKPPKKMTPYQIERYFEKAREFFEIDESELIES